MIQRTLVLAALGVALGLTSTALAGEESFTIATFADPSPDGSTPLFTYDGTTLTGAYNQPGLELLTPGLPLQDDVNDASFDMAPVAVLSADEPLIILGPGVINFRDGDDLVLRIEFDGATLVSPFGFGSSEFAGYDVTFSGPNVPEGLTAEAFAFAFANPQGNMEEYTVTAAFTSSAVPEPSSLALLAIGVVAALRRRF
jgi:hypothetical protein